MIRDVSRTSPAETLTNPHYRLCYVHTEMQNEQTTGPWAPLILGGLSLTGYWLLGAVMEHAGGVRDLYQFLGLFGILFLTYFLAIRLASTRPNPSTSLRTSTQILIWAALFRLALLGAGLPPESWTEDLRADLRSERVAYRSFLLYDNDVWRYFWDGHVFASGLVPYDWAPAELEALADDEDPRALPLFEQELWQDIFDRVSYEGYRTVYPPLAQWLFRLHHAVAPGSVLVWKTILTVFDLATCLLLLALLKARGRPALVIIYAWNPLVIKELAGSGHLDAVLIFFLVLSVYLLDQRRSGAGLIAYGLAVLTKVTPILLLGLYLRRARLRQWPLLAITLAAGYLPFLGSLETMIRSLAIFAREWVFNPGPWLLIKASAERTSLDGRAVASGASLALTVGLMVWTLRRDDGSSSRLISSSFLVLGGYLVTSATVMPWYLLWVLPFAALRAGTAAGGEKRPEVLAWLVLTALSLLSYLIYAYQIEYRWWLWVEYLGFFGVLAWGLSQASFSKTRSLNSSGL